MSNLTMLPKFNAEQKQFAVDNLKAMIPHKEIADKFLTLYPDFYNDPIDSDFFEAFFKRIKEYMRSDRPLGKEIAAAREKASEQINHTLLVHKRYRVQIREGALDRLLDLDGKLERGELEVETYKALLSGITLKLRTVSDFERNEHNEKKLTPVIAEPETDDGYPKEEDFDYGQEAPTTDS